MTPRSAAREIHRGVRKGDDPWSLSAKTEAAVDVAA